MDNDFTEQHKKRLEGNQRMLNESLRLFRSTIGQRKGMGRGDSGGLVFPSSMKVTPVRLPDRKIGLRELVRVMISQVSRRDVLYIVAVALCMTLLGMLLPYVTRQLYVQMIPSNDRSMLIPLGVLLLSAAIGTAFFEVARALLLQRDLLGLSILSVAVQLVLMFFFYIAASKEQLRVRKAGADMSGMLYDVIKGIPKIKSTSAEDRVFYQWAKLYRETMVDREDRSPFLVIYPALIALVTLGTTILTFKLSATYHIKVADYAAYMAAFGMVLAAINAISSLLPELTSIKSTISLCKPLLDNVPEGRKDCDKVTHLSGSISISNLSFRYPGQARPLFDNLSFQVKSGEYLGIVGPSGCGKSTLIRLLLGFEMPESGSIFFDYHSIDNVDIQSLRRRLGTILQNGRIFQGSIYSNLTIINPAATMDEIQEALRLSCLEEDVNNLPMGLHTLLGEGGKGLSGGQCQRLLLARTLLSKPDILILDEATSSLDNITQTQLIRNLDTLQCTRICIAHRLSTVRNCSRIIVLSDGKIVEEGTFDSLMKKKAFFYELAKRQL